MGTLEHFWSRFNKIFFPVLASYYSWSLLTTILQSPSFQKEYLHQWPVWKTVPSWQDQVPHTPTPDFTMVGFSSVNILVTKYPPGNSFWSPHSPQTFIPHASIFTLESLPDFESLALFVYVCEQFLGKVHVVEEGILWAKLIFLIRNILFPPPSPPCSLDDPERPQSSFLHRFPSDPANHSFTRWNPFFTSFH